MAKFLLRLYAAHLELSQTEGRAMVSHSRENSGSNLGLDTGYSNRLFLKVNDG